MKRHDDRHEALIGEIRRRLVNLGMPAHCFDVNAYVEEGYTPSLLAKHLRLFRGVTDDSMLEKVFANDREYSRPPIPCRCRPSARRLLLLEKLAKIRGRAPEFTPEQNAWISMFKVCRLDLEKKRAEKRRRLEASVAELESRICRAEAKMEKRLRAIEAKHFPVGSYVEMSDPDMHKACWDEYVRRLRDLGQTPPGMTGDLLEEAYDVFNGVVRMKHVLQYLDEDETRKKAFTDYIAARPRDLAS